MYRLTTWALVIWTVLMALGIFFAALGIGADCTGTGTVLSQCRADAWGRGVVGLSLLAFLWLVVAAPLWIVRGKSRPKETAGSLT